MNLPLVRYVLGLLAAALGLFQLLPAAAATWLGEPALGYATSSAVVTVSGAVLAATGRGHQWSVRPRDAFLIVGGGWVLCSVFGALPYVFTQTLGPVDALFESVSGFTTTGSTVLSNLEAKPRALLLWRAFTQWIGGMGIILFTIAILPLLGIGGMQLFKAEVPGPVAEKVRPRLVDTARHLWFIYVGLTALEVVLLLLAGLDLFEAVCHALTTLPTGGFSTRDLSIGSFKSPLVEWIVILFMLISGINFVHHYRLVTGQFARVRYDGELRLFLAVVLAGVVTVGTALVRAGHAPAEALRLASFQVVSIVTTTGYVSADFEQWSSLTHFVVIVLMVLGGMSGSTGGGIKSLRVLLAIRSLRGTFGRLIHPRAVLVVRYGGKAVDPDVLAGIWAFFSAYFLLAGLATAVLAAVGCDLVTAFSAALTAIGNVGPGLGTVGAYDNFAHLPVAAKLVLSFCMLAGRLEVFTLLVLLAPGFWRQ